MSINTILAYNLDLESLTKLYSIEEFQEILDNPEYLVYLRWRLRLPKAANDQDNFDNVVELYNRFYCTLTHRLTLMDLDESDIAIIDNNLSQLIEQVKKIRDKYHYLYRYFNKHQLEQKIIDHKLSKIPLAAELGNPEIIDYLLEGNSQYLFYGNLDSVTKSLLRGGHLDLLKEYTLPNYKYTKVEAINALTYSLERDDYRIYQYTLDNIRDDSFDVNDILNFGLIKNIPSLICYASAKYHELNQNSRTYLIKYLNNNDLEIVDHIRRNFDQ